MDAHVHWTKHAVCNSGVVIIGFGSIASSLLPVLLRHIEVSPKDVTVVCPPGNDTAIAHECGVHVVEQALWAPFVNRNVTALVSTRVDPACAVVHVLYDFDWSTICAQ